MLTILAANTAINTINFGMALVEALNQATLPDYYILRARSASIESVDSAGTISSKMDCDSGYGSGDDEDRDQGKLHTFNRCML
jgi:hypothetical protein